MKKVSLLLLLGVIFMCQDLRSQNEGFEDVSLTNPTPPSTIVVATPNAINGWTVNSGSNLGWGSTGNCTNTTAITGNPNACVLISPGSTGHIDPIIGASYPIYSVYGPTTTSYPNATTVNGFQCFGDWFIKINNSTPGASVQRISKTINVTAANCLFNFAFMNVSEGTHCCCDAPGFSLKLKVGCGPSSTYTSCPTYSAASPPTSACTPSVNCSSPGNVTSYSTSSISPTWRYSKWKLNTIDLSSFIGNCVTIEVTAYDSPYSGLAGYTYFDAEVIPMQLVVNSQNWSIVSPIFISTCSTLGTCTITAPSVVGGYTWTAFGGPGAFTVTPGSGGQQISISQTQGYTLTLNPPGSCAPIIKTFTIISSAPPFLGVMSVTQTSCTNSLSAVSLSLTSGSPNSSIIPNYLVSFSPSQPTGTIGVTANSGTYTGLAIGVNTITITDSVSCVGQNTININVNPCTGINELEWSKNISIAPNPNNGKFNVVINNGIDNGELKITNAVGQEVFRQTIKQGKTEVNATNFAKGIYYYSITQNKEPISKGKILIE